MRFTLDSNILIRAVTSPRGPALRLLDIVLDAHLLVLSRFILDEVERVLLYPRLQARHHVTVTEAGRFTASLARVAEMVEPANRQADSLFPTRMMTPYCTPPRTDALTFFVRETSDTLLHPRLGTSAPNGVSA